jgi:hypothetical protein
VVDIVGIGYNFALYLVDNGFHALDSMPESAQPVWRNSPSDTTRTAAA